MSTVLDTITPRSENNEALLASLMVAVFMGFARFAFSGIYPVMVADHILNVHSGTFAAAANYAGYLAGALAAAAIRPRHSRMVCTVALIVTIVLLAATGAASTASRATPLIILLRGLTGVLSAVGLISASVWLLQHKAWSNAAPKMFAGVGSGILLSSELLAAGKASSLHSAGLWLVLAGGALLLSSISLWGLITDNAPARARAPASQQAPRFPSIPAPRLIGLYGLAGFGYIITATYLPLFVAQSVKSIDPLQVWALFGLGSIPSCFLWHKLHVSIGVRKAFGLNLCLQAIGVLLPVLIPGVVGYMGSALIVGATFMGTTTIGMLAAGKIAATIRVNIFSAMTACFGTGQIIGPLVANALYARTGGFSVSLMCAATALFLAALLCVWHRK